MSNVENKPLLRTAWIIAAAASSAVAIVAGNAANLFQLKEAIGWWRVAIAVTIVSLAAAGYATMRQMRAMDRRARAMEDRAQELESQVDAMKRKTEVEYLRTPDEVLEKAASLLLDSKDRLDYYGGINLINADASEEVRERVAKTKLARWKNTLSDKLRDDRFAVTRYIDFLLPSELAALYDEQQVPQRQIMEQVEEYRDWIRTQRESLNHGAARNGFFNLRGAPIWQWGMHVLVFDRKHVMFVYTDTRRNYHALLLADNPEAATDIQEAFLTWHESLRRRPVSLEQMRAAEQDAEDWLKPFRERERSAQAMA
ncbi:hypothetical protein [Longimicrobium terrae]|uniref:Uncharacterized protein n=1 Tax=Longimicrobium terrae TaxID=1639882 RepID=A0A841GUR2_9BACT|nr:hypothetical protein [Longimicrobium terrae]MBB4634803.1 hypothetical protein [Longimicrobium terrae]MBB6069198.1 hypothetical protein [Longimicrobium terrae]NNC31990.1 hypothetical protein [Longimicrobium terrae]